MPSSWTKQPQQLLAVKMNTAGGDSALGGGLATVPSGVAGANQGSQTQLGDRLVLGVADALALSDTVNVGTLYDGLYQYVQFANSTATPTLGHLCFWQTSVADGLYRVTCDETDTLGVNEPAGVLINAPTKLYYWWILIAGKVSASFATPLTGVPAAGQAVFAAAVGAGNPGALDVLDGGGNPTFTQVALMQNRYMGVAEAAPTAGASSVIRVPLRLVRF